MSEDCDVAASPTPPGRRSRRRIGVAPSPRPDLSRRLGGIAPSSQPDSSQRLGSAAPHRAAGRTSASASTDERNLLAALPAARVGHGRPRLRGRFRRPGLQQLDRDPVGRTHEGHASVAGRPVDRHAVLLQAPAGGVDVVDLVGEMAEVAPARVRLRIPVVRQLDLGRSVAARGEEDQGVATLGEIAARQQLEPERITVEAQRSLDVGHADHGVQVLHGRECSLPPR